MAPSTGAVEHSKLQLANATSLSAASARLNSTPSALERRSGSGDTSAGDLKPTASFSMPTKAKIHSFGDNVGWNTALDSHMDLAAAAGEHKKKYILVKKKPKHKKIKMEVFEPKMKYKKIKMKIPVKKMKKKKVKGYLVKKEHGHHGY